MPPYPNSRLLVKDGSSCCKTYVGPEPAAFTERLQRLRAGAAPSLGGSLAWAVGPVNRWPVCLSCRAWARAPVPYRQHLCPPQGSHPPWRFYDDAEARTSSAKALRSPGRPWLRGWGREVKPGPGLAEGAAAAMASYLSECRLAGLRRAGARAWWPMVIGSHAGLGGGLR